MKRFVTAALAAATLAAPLAMPASAAAHERDGRYRDRDRDWDDDDDRDRDWRRDHDGRDWRDRRHAHRRWDRRSHNGYAYRGQWYYGPPPVAYYNDPYFDPGYRAWRRGDRLPRYYRNSYRDVDWRDCGLRPPPRGYRYVEDDRGDYLLVAIATGVILSVILGAN